MTPSKSAPAVGQVWRERDPRVTVPEAVIVRFDEDGRVAILKRKGSERERRITVKHNLLRRWDLVE